MTDALVQSAIDVHGHGLGGDVPHGGDMHPLSRHDVAIGVDGGVRIAAEERELGAQGGNDEVVGRTRHVRWRAGSTAGSRRPD